MKEPERVKLGLFPEPAGVIETSPDRFKFEPVLVSGCRLAPRGEMREEEGERERLEEEGDFEREEEEGDFERLEEEGDLEMLEAEVDLIKLLLLLLLLMFKSK